jgi:hypothetical protein
VTCAIAKSSWSGKCIQRFQVPPRTRRNRPVTWENRSEALRSLPGSDASASDGRNQAPQRTDGTVAFRVVWRAGGTRDGDWQSETLYSARGAEHFRAESLAARGVRCAAAYGAVTAGSMRQPHNSRSRRRFGRTRGVRPGFTACPRSPTSSPRTLRQRTVPCHAAVQDARVAQTDRYPRSSGASAA